MPKILHNFELGIEAAFRTMAIPVTTCTRLLANPQKLNKNVRKHGMCSRGFQARVTKRLALFICIITQA